MVSDAIAPEQLSALNAEFDGLIAGTEPGTPNHIPMLIDFMGHKTVRIDGLPGKSKAFVELLQHPLALDMADHYLLPSCLHYLLSTAQLIEIQADETVQHLHRDDTAWIHPPIPTDRDAAPTPDVPQLEVIVLYALCDFTTDNGATGWSRGAISGRAPQAAGARGGGCRDEGRLGDLLPRQDPPRRGTEPDAGPAAGVRCSSASPSGGSAPRRTSSSAPPSRRFGRCHHGCSSCSATRPTAASGWSTSAVRACS